MPRTNAPTKAMLSLRIPPRLLAQVDALANLDGVTRNAICEAALSTYARSRAKELAKPQPTTPPPPPSPSIPRD